MSGASKRKRADDGEDEDMGLDLSLKEAIGAYKNADIDVFYGLKAFVDSAERGDMELFRLFHCTYIDDVENLGLFVVPLYLRLYEAVRDPGTGRITCIHDNKSKLEGDQLGRALALSSLKAQGFDVVIFNKKDEARNSCLGLKSIWQIEVDTSTKRKSHHTEVHKLFHERGFTRVYTTRELLGQVFSHEYIPLSKVRTIASKLNTLVERQECTLEVSKLTKLKKILEAQTDEQRRAESDFLEELLAASVDQASAKTVIHAFMKKPSPSLARRLKLLKPYQGKLVDRSTNREAPRVSLADLADTDHVLLSSVSVDTKFYHSVTGDVLNWSVYKASPNLGLIKEKKGWVALEGQTSMEAKYVRQMLKAIASDNDPEESAPTGATSTVPEGLAGDIEI